MDQRFRRAQAAAARGDRVAVLNLASQMVSGQSPAQGRVSARNLVTAAFNRGGCSDAAWRAALANNERFEEVD